MEEVNIVGVDLAKQAFQLHGAAADGRVLFRKKLSRLQFAKFMASLAPCVVAMEVCGIAHCWGRELSQRGHDVRLIPPVYVKPFVKRQKNDAADAEAVAEAALRPTMRCVTIKTAYQQARAMLFRRRDLLVGQRTQLVSALRGHLAEHGIISGHGAGNIARLAKRLEEEPVSEPVRDLVRIYHMPGQRHNARTKISPAKGERWFCSPAEARAAGWRAARQWKSPPENPHLDPRQR